MIAGLHVPFIAFVDNAGAAAPAHMLNEVPKLKVGVTIGLTVTVKLAGNAHWPAVGVNV
jgi:hypothetical protein